MIVTKTLLVHAIVSMGKITRIPANYNLHACGLNYTYVPSVLSTRMQDGIKVYKYIQTNKYTHLLDPL